MRQFGLCYSGKLILLAAVLDDTFAFALGQLVEHRITLFPLVLGQLFGLGHVHLRQFDEGHVGAEHLLMEGLRFRDGGVGHLLLVLEGFNFDLVRGNCGLGGSSVSCYLAGFDFGPTFRATYDQIKTAFIFISCFVFFAGGDAFSGISLHLFLHSSKIRAHFSYFDLVHEGDFSRFCVALGRLELECCLIPTAHGLRQGCV